MDMVTYYGHNVAKIKITILVSLRRFKGIVNCQNSRDKGPPECISARG